MIKPLVLAIVAMLGAVPAEAQPQAAPPPASRYPLLGFSSNEGQWTGGTQFGGRAGRTGVSFEPGRLTWWPRSVGGHAPRSLRLLDGRRVGPWTAGTRSPGSRAFFLGNDSARWRSQVPAFTSLACSSADGSVTITASEEPGRLALAFRVERLINEAEPVLMEMIGAYGEDLESGVARLAYPDGVCLVRLHHVTEVDAAGNARELVGRLAAEPGGRLRLGLDKAPSDSATLLVNTSLEWSTYLGGSDVELVDAIAWTADGDVIIGGTTESGDFPATAGAFDPTADPCGPCVVDFWNAFVARLSDDGTMIVWATYLGGAAPDDVKDLHVGLDGQVTIFGQSFSDDYPTTDGVMQPVAPISQFSGNGVVTRLNADGSELVFSTYFGGVDNDYMNGGTVAGDGTILMTGSTLSLTLPAGGGPSSGGFGPDDAFVARLLPDASDVIFSIKLEGVSFDFGRDIDVLSDGRVAVVGHTLSTDFTYTPGAFEPTPKGGFVAVLHGGTGVLEACTALGGDDGSDVPRAVKVDALDRIFVAGYTDSQDFPTTPDAYQTSVLSSTSDGFVSCFDPSLATLLHSTCFGSVGSDEIQALHLTASGLVTVGGWTGSKFLPVTPGAFDTTFGGPSSTTDAFVARLDRDLTTLHYCTYLGGAGTELLNQGHTALDVAPDGRVTVAVGTTSSDFPVTPGSFDTQLSGNTDAAVLVMDLLPTGVQRVGTSTPGSAGPLPMGVTSQPYIGSETFALHGGGAPPGSHRGLLLLSLEALGQPVTLGGAALWVDPATLFLVLPVHSDSYGYVQVPLRMPTDPAAAGLQACGQFAWRDPGAMPGPWAASHALRITLQP